MKSANMLTYHIEEALHVWLPNYYCCRIRSSWRAMTGVKPRSGGQVSSWSRVMGHS